MTTLVCMVVANMIGAGIFTISGYSLADLHHQNWVLLAWIVGGVIAICGAVGYGAAARMVTESGGEFIFLTKMLHPSIGFMAGWVSLLAGFTGAIALAATTFEVYALPNGVNGHGLVAIGAILLFAFFHSTIAHFGIRNHNWIIAFKLLLIVLFLLISAVLLGQYWNGFGVRGVVETPSLLEFASALVWISLGYSGFNSAVYVASEVRDAKRTVPRSMLLGTIIVTVLYLLLNLVFLYGPHPDLIRGEEQVGAIAAFAIGGPKLEWMLRFIVVTAMLSSVSSMILAGPRVYERMAEHGLFPQIAQKRNRDNTTPHVAVWIQAVLACIVVAITTLRSLLDYLSLTLSISAALTVLAMLIFAARKKTDDALGLLASVCGAIYVVATLGLAAIATYHSPQKLYGVLATVVTGGIVYMILSWIRKSPPPESEPSPNEFQP
ncbi:MAG: APC family permease [Pirellulaceae bacterium]